MMPHRAAVAVATLALVTTVSRAQEGPRPELTGSLRGGYWSSTRTLDRQDPLGAGMFWLKGTSRLSADVTLFAEGWAALRGPVDDSDATAELREAYVTVTKGKLDLRAGRQIIAWGRADGVNPTGSLGAEDLTLLTPDDADRRLGATTAMLSYFFGGLSVSGIWIPEFRGHRIALPGGDDVSVLDTKDRWPGDQWAIRLEHTGGSVDWSMSMFRGLDLSPDLEPAGAANTIALRYRRINVFGADAAATVGRYGLRAEGAYVRTNDVQGDDPFTKNPFVFVVIGGDRTYNGRLNVNLQYLARAVIRFRELPADSPPHLAAIAQQQAILSSQSRRVQHGASMRASYKWLHETLETEWAAVAYAGPQGVAMRPKVTYAVTDRLTLITGAELFRGDDGSVFGLLRPNSGVFAELRWGF